MTTVAHLRTTATSHPGTVDGCRHWTVDGVRFAALDAPAIVRLRLPSAEAADMAAQHDGAEVVDDGVRLPIRDIDGQALRYWVRRAWLAAAPPEAAAQAEAAANTAAGEVGNLPKTIGRPATRALANAGITTLDQVAARTDTELAALHGVGPKAIRILRETLAQQ
jgi:hypothetical protein